VSLGLSGEEGGKIRRIIAEGQQVRRGASVIVVSGGMHRRW
jgi:hypothetical protein